MGTTFSTIQIQNRQHAEPEHFKKTLSKYIKKKGLVPTTKEKAQLVYKFVFSADGNWITLSSSEYEIGSDSVNSDVQGLAKAMKTCCIGTSVFDSDALFLYLFDAPGKQKDMVALGHLGDMSDSEYAVGMGNIKCWSPLLSETATWEQLTEFWNEEYVFVEEALVKMAPLLGIDSKNIAADYHYWNEVEPDNQSVVNLYFETVSPMFITEGPTKLDFSMWTSVTMLSGNDSIISFHNTGGISKGLTVLILGDCFEQGKVEIGKMQVDKLKNLNDLRSERVIETIHPVKKQLSDGRFGLVFDLVDFEFPEGVNTEHPSVKGFSKKGMEILIAHSVTLRFIATIQADSKHCLSFFVIPHNNWTEGQAGRTISLYETQEQMNAEFGIPE